MTGCVARIVAAEEERWPTKVCEAVVLAADQISSTLIIIVTIA